MAGRSADQDRGWHLLVSGTVCDTERSFAVDDRAGRAAGGTGPERADSRTRVRRRQTCYTRVNGLRRAAQSEIVVPTAL